MESAVTYFLDCASAACACGSSSDPTYDEEHQLDVPIEYDAIKPYEQEPAELEDDCEPIAGYAPGGYHPVAVGDRFGEDGRFVVRAKLGWGVYSTVWLATDVQSGSRDSAASRIVALKVQRSAPEYYRAALDEVRVLGELRRRMDTEGDSLPVIRLLANFDHNGPHGTHPCMVFQALEASLLMVLNQNGALGEAATRDIARQSLVALEFLQRCSVIHGDIKPENIFVTTLAGGKFDVKIGDFGNCVRLGTQRGVDAIQTREYRCPESILCVTPFRCEADVWSLGCVMYEMLTGNVLFDPPAPTPPKELFTLDESHLASAIQILGPVPRSLLARSKRAHKFFADERPGTPRMLRHLQHIQPFAERGVRADLEKYAQLERDAARVLNELVLEMLRFDPCDRCDAKACQRNKWFAAPP